MNLNNAKPIKCNCGSILFEEKIVMMKVSKLVSASGKNEFMKVPVPICSKCGMIPYEIDQEAAYSENIPELKSMVNIKLENNL